MTQIRVTHATCGEQVLGPEDIELRVGPARAWYRFLCSWCARHVLKAADDRTVRLLRLGGVEPLPLLSAEAPARRGGAPIDWDDVIAFGLALEGDEAGVWRELGVAHA